MFLSGLLPPSVRGGPPVFGASLGSPDDGTAAKTEKQTRFKIHLIYTGAFQSLQITRQIVHREIQTHKLSQRNTFQSYILNL